MREPKRGLSFNDKNHTYRLDGQYVPGVTTILGVLDKPAIARWAATTVAEYVADNPDAVANLRTMGRDPMVQALKGLPWARRDDAGKRGNILHDYAEQLLAGQDVEVEDQHVDVMQSALDFMADWKIEPLLIEAAVASREHRWAGTLDLIAGYTRPDTGTSGVGIFDWKSGKALYPEFAWQLNAYAHAEFHGLAGQEQPLPECDAAFGVQIRDNAYTVAPLAFGRDIYDEFLAILAAYRVAKRGRGDYRQPGSGHVGIPILTRQAS